MEVTPGWLVLCIFLAAALLLVLRQWRQQARAAYIRSFVFPDGLFARVAARHPHLHTKDHQLVAQGLRQFFLAYLLGGRRFVSMPSQVVDDLWHEFILYTRNYATFCNRAFGRFLHHAPAVVLTRDRHDNTGLRRVWWHCCKQENIDPRKATRLPLLFALDAKLQIVGGFVYAADCSRLRHGADPAHGGAVHCGGDMGSTSFDGSTDGMGDGDGGSGGGDGCGGGGCGGD